MSYRFTTRIQPERFININVTPIADYIPSAIPDVIKEQFAFANYSNDKKLLTRQGTADLLGISVGTVHNWTKAGDLTAHTKGRKVYYTVYNS